MCGRYALSTPPQVLAALFKLSELLPFEPHFNLAPTQEAPIVRNASTGGRKLTIAKWGLVPFWAEDPSCAGRMINARAEGISGKSAYREAIARRRCLVPADGFFEWRTTPAGKQPYFVRRADGQPLVMAGLWERWRDKAAGKDSPPLETFTIITTAASPSIAMLHDRMPVVLEPEEFDRWLDASESDPAQVQPLLDPAPEGVLTFHPVSNKVNSVKNDARELVEPVPAALGLFEV